MCEKNICIIIAVIAILIIICLIISKDNYNVWNNNETYPVVAGISGAYLAHDLLGDRKDGVRIADNQSVTGVVYETIWNPSETETITTDIVSDLIRRCKKYDCNAIVYDKNLNTFKIMKSTDFDLSVTDVNAMTIYNF